MFWMKDMPKFLSFFLLSHSPANLVVLTFHVFIVCKADLIPKPLRSSVVLYGYPTFQKDWTN